MRYKKGFPTSIQVFNSPGIQGYKAHVVPFTGDLSTDIYHLGISYVKQNSTMLPDWSSWDLACTQLRKETRE